MINEKLLKSTKFNCASGMSGEQKTIDFELPLNSGDTGLSVLCLKKFFNAGTGTTFDKKLKNNLSKWQLQNFRQICLIAGWINRQFVGSAEDVPELEFEIGSLQPATFVAMKIAGSGAISLSNLNEHYDGYAVVDGDYLIKISNMFGFSLQEVVSENPQIEDINLIRVGEKINIPDHKIVVETYNEINFNEAVSRAYEELENTEAEQLALSPDKDLLTNIPLSDAVNEPYKDSEFYYSIWDSKMTRSNIKNGLEQFIKSNSSKALKMGTVSLFSFYSKKTTWEIDLRTNSGSKFTNFLKKQGRLEEGVDVYQATIEPIDPIEALGLNAGVNRVDLLSFQDLTEGVTPDFASIAKVVMPELKPRSTFKFIIAVRAELFDAIPTEHKTVSQQKKAGSVSSNTPACSDEDLLTMTDNFDLGDNDFENRKTRLRSMRQLAKLKQLNSNEQITPDIQEQIDQRVREINKVELAEFKEKLEDLPFVVYYKISELEKDIKSVHRMMTSYNEVLEQAKSFGVSMSPDVSLKDEADNLLSTVNAIKKLGGYNDVEISEENLDTLIISYRVITSGPEDNQKIEGLEIKSVSVLKINPGIKVFDAGIGNFLKSSPMTSRTTVSYLALLNIIKKDAAKFNSVKLQGADIDRADVLAFISLYHLPKPKIDFSALDVDFNKVFGSTIEDFDFSVNKIKSLSSNLKLNYNLTNNIGIMDKIKLRTFEVEKFREFIITDKLPININFGSLDELFTEFFDRYDMLSLFVDFGQMVPDFKVCEPEWDFDFSVPKLPRMPTFDPIAFIVRQLNLAIQDLLLSILSSIVKMILKFLSNSSSPVSGLEDFSRKANMEDIFPNDDIYEFGDPDLKDRVTSKFTDMSTRGIIGNPGVVNRMRTAGKKLGLSPDAIGELPKMFETITNTCTPQEIADLLNGDPTPEVSKVVLNVTKKTCGSLSRKINDTSDIIKVCKAVGDLVNPSVMDKLKTFSFGAPFSEIEIPCPDDIGVLNSDKQIRDTLERLDASEEEVNRAVADAKKRRDSIKNFFTKNPVAAQMPGGKNGLAGLPSPYENENMNRLTELAAEGVFGNVEAVFMSEISGFVPLLYRAQTRFLTEDDHDFDHVGMAEYQYVKNQLDRLGDTTSPIYKPGVINFKSTDADGRPTSPVVRSVEQGPEFDLADRVDSSLLQQILMRPMNNTRQSLEVFPDFYNYLNNPRTNFVGTTDDNLQFLIKGVTPALDTDIINFAERGYDNKKFNVKIADKFYYHTPVDCYDVTRTPRIFEQQEESGMQTFKYNQDLSEEMSSLIESTSPGLDSDVKKLLRPEAFAKLLCDSVSKTVQLAEQRRNVFNDNSSPEVDTYYKNNSRFTDIGFSRNNQIYTSVIGKKFDVDDGDTAEFNAGQYAFTAQYIMDQIAQSVAKSKFFNKQELQLLSEKISSKYIEDFSNGIRCLKKTKGVIDFEEVRKSALQDYKDSLSREEFNPLNRDFSKPGPLEESFSDQLVFIYIKTFVVEFALKSIFISSRFSLTYMLEQKFIYDFFVDYMIQTLETEFSNSNRYKINFYDQIKKIANLKDEKEAISSLVAKIFTSTKNEIEKITNELFESDYTSFHEQYFNDLSNGITSVPKFVPYGYSSVARGEQSYILKSDDKQESFSSNENLDVILNQELKKNSGFFMLEYYYKIHNPKANDPNYVSKCLGYYRKAFPDANEGAWPFLYRSGQSEDDSSDSGGEIHVDIQCMAAQRMDQDTFNRFVKRVDTSRFDNSLTYVYNDRTYDTPYGLMKKYLRVGIRMVYVSGRNQQGYETALYADGPSTFGEANTEKAVLAYLGLGRRDLAEVAASLNLLTWPSLYDQVKFRNPLVPSSIITGERTPEWRPISNSMKLGPVKFHRHYKENNLAGSSNSSTSATVFDIQASFNNSFEVANHEISVDCYDDIGNDSETRSGVRSGTYPGQVFITAYREKLFEEFLGLENKGVTYGTAKLNKAKIKSQNIKVLFNDIFPLDRMASMYFVNEHGFFDSTDRFADLLGGTRGAIRSTYRILKNKGSNTNPGEFGIGDKTQVPAAESYSVIESNMTSNGPSGDVANNLMGDFAPQIAKVVAQTPITLIRGLASSLDPGYAKMNQIASEDPCVLRDGAGIRSLRMPMYTFPNKTINSGLKSDQYIPVTVGAPVDVGLSIALMSNIFTFPFGVKGLTNSLTHTFNAISGDSSSKAYGLPLTPLGLLALSLPHLSGEDPNKKKREANCPAGSGDPIRDTKGNIINGDGQKMELQRCEDDTKEEDS